MKINTPLPNYLMKYTVKGKTLFNQQPLAVQFAVKKKTSVIFTCKRKRG